MAYHKTKLVRAHLESQEQLIINTAIALLGKGEMVTAKAIAEQADISVGKVFNYFADMTELNAKVEATIMARDMAAFASAVAPHKDHPTRALAAAVLILFVRLSMRPSREMMAHGQSYRFSVARQLASLVGPVVLERMDARLAARASLGVIFELAGADGPSDKRVSTAVLFVLKALGVSETTAQKAMEAVDA